MSTDRYAVDLDRSRSVCLCGQGSPNYLAAVCVDPDGETEFWLIDESVLNDPNAPHGNPDQPHERVGRLSANALRRIWGDPRCGRPRSNGEPCRAQVAELGQPCRVHRIVEVQTR